MRYAHQVRRRALAVAVVMGLVLAGCGADPPAPEPPGPTTPASSPAAWPEPGPGLHELRFPWADQQREILLYAPDGYDPAEPTPLIVVLHGRPSTAADIQELSRMDELAQEHGVLIAYPQGVGGGWQTVVGAQTRGVDDVGFLRALVGELVAEWNVAPGEVYAAGFSAGAAMTYRLALAAADVFAAVAPVSGRLGRHDASAEPAGPVSVVGFVGLDDQPVVDADSLQAWRELRDCAPGDPTPVGESGRVTSTIASCSDGSEVVEYRIEDAGHVWPHLDEHGIDATAAMWSHFRSYARS